MFLQQINKKNPTFNNICPQTDLINFQLNQTRKAGSLSKPRKHFHAQKYQLVRCSKEPSSLTPEEKEKLAGKCSYALFNNQVYYIDSNLEVKPELLKQSPSSKDAEHDGIFPDVLDLPKEASISDLQKLNLILKESPKNMMVKWETIKDILTEEVDSKTNGYSGRKI
jgi:hypothetical protein